ncbi:alpha-2,8-polysialyltransferase family protein [Halobacillus halophilus]|uniref:alpha-2,8-polysialyltransferase family protein n=1 Tax=Halobacillus halophilus TaxID=1570 RepID=UPI001CD7906F|nr:alpha-2,8-polysialyltransferase family protein [Halobacillus halophilus]MCA1012703.1 alpha-2,8-polysialyltransferase family protein [Halobacillus halophilus]
MGEPQKICFVASSNYQVMMAYFIQIYLKQECYIISYSINERVNKLAEELFTAERSLLLPRVKKDLKSLLWDNRKIFRKASDFTRNLAPEKVIVFKDNDFMNACIIEESVKSKAKIMMLQEGLGIYTKHRINFKRKMIQWALSFIGYPKIYSDMQAMHPAVKWIAINDEGEFPEYKKTGRTIVPLPAGLPPSKYLASLADAVDIRLDDVPRYEKSILFLGQPLSEINLVDKDIEIRYLERVFKIIKENFTLFVKPHPSEDLSKYTDLQNVHVFNESAPAELLPAFFPFTAVVSSSSSAGDNMALAFQLPAFYLHHLTIKKRLDYEKKMNGTFIYSYEQLKTELSVLKERTGERNIADGDISYQRFASQILNY